MSEDWDGDPPSEFHPVEGGTRFTGPTYDDKWGSGDNNNNGNRGNVERSSSGRDFRDVKWESGDNNYDNNGYRRNVEWGTNVKERRVGRGRRGFGRDVDSRHKPNNINNRWGENHQEGALGDRGDDMWENGDNNKGNRGNVERNSSGTDRRGRGRCFGRDVDSHQKFNNSNKGWGENDQEGERGEREDDNWESGDNYKRNRDTTEWGNSGKGTGNRRRRGYSRGGVNRFNNDETWDENGEEGARGSTGGHNNQTRSGSGVDDSWGERSDGAWGEDDRGRRCRDMGDSNRRGRTDIDTNDVGPEKPREIYVPLERVGEDDLFTTTITSGVNFIKLTDVEVNVSGQNVPRPIASFEASQLRQLLCDNVKRSGYTTPTPIQKHAIPIIANGRDLLGCAQTGSGKTAAFLLPIINKLMEYQSPPITENGTAHPIVVIISPTRELAIQIYEQARKFAYHTIVKVVMCYGGTSVFHQTSQVSRGCHILVTTPGRLIDFLSRNTISFASCNCFVLDEADRMLDMGFISAVEQMLGHETMPATGVRQTLMFSATFPEEVQVLAGKFLYNYIFVAVGIVGSASSDVEQYFHMVSKYNKREMLIEMLQKSKGKEKTIVFVETKRNTDFLAALLSESDIQSTSIHGDRLQREREQALWDFKKGTRNILVATAVAARGLDIEGIQHVINYDLPKSIDEYVHRIGRTGRVGNCGKATSFYDPDVDSGLARPLTKILEQAGIIVPEFLRKAGYGGRSSDGFSGRDVRGNDYGTDVKAAFDPCADEW
ncbi:ATP-dependent RNA helicase vasa-like isoform X2 [Aethina tumida]|uniref:ATP-dependent RNA helicase vasa-like isoform X2 n=1 Tax=Aethina tumida TaxID=116153 RepID=UPI002148DBD1|nr:ATP-dependent RNA helicase vasa-like isoform X2 [Aethina tumida]